MLKTCTGIRHGVFGFKFSTPKIPLNLSTFVSKSPSEALEGYVVNTHDSGFPAN